MAKNGALSIPPFTETEKKTFTLLLADIATKKKDATGVFNALGQDKIVYERFKLFAQTAKKLQELAKQKKEAEQNQELAEKELQSLSQQKKNIAQQLITVTSELNDLQDQKSDAQTRLNALERTRTVLVNSVNQHDEVISASSNQASKVIQTNLKKVMINQPK